MSPDEIKDKRLSLRMTQQEFATALGVSRRSVVEWEAGRSQASLSTQARIAALVPAPTAPRGKRYAPDEVISDSMWHAAKWPFGRNTKSYFMDKSLRVEDFEIIKD